MKRRFTARAHRDLENILTYIERENPRAAAMVASEIEKTVNLICKMPLIGRQSARPGTREFSVNRAPLLVVYRINADVIEVLTVFHTSRDPRTK